MFPWTARGPSFSHTCGSKGAPGSTSGSCRWGPAFAGMQSLAKYLYPRGLRQPEGCQRVDNLFAQPHQSSEENESCWLCAAGPAHTDLTCCLCQDLPNTEPLINKLSFSQGRCQQAGWHPGKPNPVNRISCSCLKSTPLPVGIRERFCLCRPTVHAISSGPVWILCTEWGDALTH